MSPLTQIVAGLIGSAAIAASSRMFRFLTTGGACLQFALGWLLFAAGGFQWTVPILVFFFSSSVLSRVLRFREIEARERFSKREVRDWIQVAANGGVTGVLVLVWLIDRSPALYAAYLGTVAAACADTWGTELGLLSRGKPRLVTNWRTVERGSSGAVSLVGSASGLAGALLVIASGLPWTDSRTIVSSLSGGIAGAILDSILGATVQAHYACVVCGQSTEKARHCDTQARLAYGNRWVTNDIVNLACTMGGAAVSWLVFCAISN